MNLATDRSLRRALARLAATVGMTCAAASLAQPGASPAPSPDTYTLLRCGRLMARPGATANQPDAGVQRDVTVVVRNGAIDSVVPGLTGPDLSAARASGASVAEVDLRDSFVMPGFIDCHVHLWNEYDATVRQRAVTETDGDKTIRALLNARKTLDAGFTTVRDLGSKGTAVYAVRDAINRGEIPGPRILMAGEAISVTGGHGDDTLGFRPDLFPVPGPDDGIADGESECMKAVRHQIKLGADCIKLMSTGGVLSASAAGLAQHFTDDELSAIVRTAHSMGRTVAAHAHGTDGINAAIRAGVDSIEHGTYQDDESIRLFKEHGCYYVPTLLAAETVGRNAETPGFYLPMVADKARLVRHRAIESFRKAHQAGVKIAFGTDSGVSPHGQNAQEFALMVKGGMTPAQSIAAATAGAADLCGIAGTAGSIEPGKQADIIAVRGEPLNDIAGLERVTFVMRAGRVHKNTPK
ncbi:MAG: amidohydrolase family protein [Phycisphaerales bacterium]